MTLYDGKLLHRFPKRLRQFLFTFPKRIFPSLSVFCYWNLYSLQIFLKKLSKRRRQGLKLLFIFLFIFFFDRLIFLKSDINSHPLKGIPHTIPGCYHIVSIYFLPFQFIQMPGPGFYIHASFSTVPTLVIPEVCTYLPSGIYG